MIKLKKTPEPKHLAQVKAQLSGKLAEYASSGNRLPRTIRRSYRIAEVKSQLITETNGKCAYCESKITHTQFTHIEHIFPASKDPTFLLEWSNLTLSCELCNHSKGDKIPQEYGIVNPYLEDPSNYIFFDGAIIVGSTDFPGGTTIIALSLNRAELVERRQECLQSISRVLSLMNGASIEARRAVFSEIICPYLSEKSEYTAALREFVRLNRLWLETALDAKLRDDLTL